MLGTTQAYSEKFCERVAALQGAYAFVPGRILLLYLHDQHAHTDSLSGLRDVLSATADMSVVVLVVVVVIIVVVVIVVVTLLAVQASRQVAATPTPEEIRGSWPDFLVISLAVMSGLGIGLLGLCLVQGLRLLKI